MYVTMHMEDAEVPTIIIIGADNAQRERARANWRSFDVLGRQCFVEEDKTRILAVVEHHPGGVQGFNIHVQALASALSRFSATESDWTGSFTFTTCRELHNSSVTEAVGRSSTESSPTAACNTVIGLSVLPAGIPGSISFE